MASKVASLMNLIFNVEGEKKGKHKKNKTRSSFL